MDRRKVLLITSTGLVGGNLLKVLENKNFSIIESFYPAVETGKGVGIDITNNADLKKVFQENKPDIVVLNAALTHVDLCEENNELAKKINIEGTRNVALNCNEFNSKLVFFSSDYVFDGNNGPYSEDDPTNPISYYGVTKLEGEKLIKQLVKDYLIIRTTVVFGFEKLGKNFCYRLINTLKQGQKINIPQDQIGNPTYAYNLAQVVVELLEKKQTGIFNVVGKDLVDRYQFALAVCQEFGLDSTLMNPIKTSDLNQKAKRPLKAGLKVEKAEKILETKILGVEESLKLFKKELSWNS